MAALAAALLGGACSDDGPATATSPSPSADSSPTPPAIEPVAAEITVTQRSLSSGAVIDRSQSPAPDADAVAALASSVTAWLDAHLDSLQRGGEGTLAEVAGDGMLTEAEPALVAGVTTDLTSPDDPIRAATYDLEVGHHGVPRWLRARIAVRGASGGITQATFVFVPGDDGDPVLIALEPRGGVA